MQPHPPGPQVGTVSPDGYWRWDGTRWMPTIAAAPVGPVSPTLPIAPPRPFRSPRLFADLATTFLVIIVVLNVVDIINSGIDLGAYGGRLGAVSESTHMLWTLARNTIVAVSWIFVAFPGSVVMSSLWLYRAYANLEPLGHPGRTSPALALGWFFIPIANVWMPYRVVKEIWDNTLATPSRGLVATWWASWLAGIVVGNLQLVLSLRETSDPASHTVPLLLSVASDLVWIAAALLLIRIMRSVTAAQEHPATETWTPPRG
jgi:Domain of unknown function (DUF4328)